MIRAALRSRGAALHVLIPALSTLSQLAAAYPPEGQTFSRWGTAGGEP